MYKFILFPYFLMVPIANFAQDLSSHQWKNRLIIIQTKNPGDPLFKQQIHELQTHQKGLDERRIVVYQNTDQKYRQGLTLEGKWVSTFKESEKSPKENKEFQISLIGLDGGVKLQKNTVLSCDELFKTIDQMPMRQSEMKRKKDGSAEI
ncbi:DUF4174 domain-containing protein [Algoriphagus halophytocola]|uniref:DUF4174 domain-containing protein n=1 Tax=Algoriphagus halophytocola TaxID=2991499 RepID=A0ABY6MID1_9BACT|nr:MULTISPECIES: DUF4174 domain-containing protein [unclassified Algoriphagus]UZD22739.1 DUF4174 domain-containing protein [Algoriphagus sp. TR-M5]WBL44004.1 DUF4174 domain-containing protein [Algoriphagus sp. TR-M9]